MSFKEDKKHFPRLGKAFQQFMHNEAFLHSRYIFIRRLGRKRFGYCTYCHKDFELHRSYSHNEPMECPECKSQCLGRHAGRGHKTLIDQSYFVFYEKSKLDPKVVVARGFFAVMDYGGNDVRSVKARYKCESYYIFKAGEKPRMYRQKYRFNSVKNTWLPYIVQCKSAYSLFPEYMGQSYDTYSSRDNIAEAVKGTPFQYSTWEEYQRRSEEDVTKFLGLYCKYPCIEYLTKLNLSDVVKDKLYRHGRTFGAVNWNGKTLPAVLRMNLSKDDVQALRSCPLDSKELRFWQAFREENPGIPLDVAMKIFKGVFNGMELKDLFPLKQRAPWEKIAPYLQKQFEKDKEQYFSQRQVGITYRDYLRDTETLELDLADPSVLFPKSLYRMHQNTMKQIRIRKDEIVAQKIIKRAEVLQRYCFENESILIKPIETMEELIREGKVLQHCVGTYAEKHASGTTTILVIRNKEKPEKPFYTLELRESDIFVIQVRGRKNCAPTPEVDKFVAQFKLAKLGKKKGAKTA